MVRALVRPVLWLLHQRMANAFANYNYTFVTVESSGCNAFFVDPLAFPPGFTDGLRGEPFRDNDGDLNGATRPAPDAEGDDVLPARNWRFQKSLMSKLKLDEIRY
jgi:hypothetical protein